MTKKIIMTWDIKPEHEQDYFEFVVREFIPGIQRLGFELTDAWATVYGNQPQILVAALITDKQSQAILNSTEWINLKNKLMDFVYNYIQKLVKVRGGFQF